MKKIFTLLIFVFLANTMLLAQCPDEATPNPTNRIFNMIYALEADRDMAWEALDSVTFPAGVGAPDGESTVTIAKAELEIDGPVSDNNVYRIRARTTTNDFFGGVNGSFEGTLIFDKSDGTSESCDYEITSNTNINGIEQAEVFPNPVIDQLTIINGKGKATIYNVLGQPVKQTVIDSDHTTIQLDGLLNGQYYLCVIQKDGTIVMKQFSKT